MSPGNEILPSGDRRDSGGDAYLELAFAPNELIVPTVRRFLGDFFDKVLSSREVADRVMVATHEMLENAVRYSRDGQTQFSARLWKRGEGVEVVLTTTNQTEPSDFQAVQALVQAMKDAPNEAVYYSELMRKAAARTSGSGLGLGRVFAESGMQVECDVKDGALTLSARGFFDCATGVID
jgi:hypothetical protein